MRLVNTVCLAHHLPFRFIQLALFIVRTVRLHIDGTPYMCRYLALDATLNFHCFASISRIYLGWVWQKCGCCRRCFCCWAMRSWAIVHHGIKILDTLAQQIKTPKYETYHTEPKDSRLLFPKVCLLVFFFFFFLRW